MSFQSRCEQAADRDFPEILTFAMNVFHVDFPTLLPLIYGKDATSGPQHFVVREDGKVAAAVLNYPYEYKIGESDCTAYGVGTVSVGEGSRGKGYMSDLLASCLCQASEDRAVVSVLGGLRQRYDYYGFARTGNHIQTVHTAYSVRHTLGERPSRYTIRAAVPEDAASMKRIMETQTVFVSRRTEDFWTLTKHGYHEAYLVLEGEEPVGYFISKEDWKDLAEFVLVPGASVDELLLALMKKTDRCCVPVGPHADTLAERLLAVCEDWHVTMLTHACVLDIPRLFNAFGTLYAGTHRTENGSFVLGVEPHPFFEKIGIAREGVTNGRFRIGTQDGRFFAEPTQSDADITLPYLRAMEVAFTGNGRLLRDLPAFARTLFPLPFYFPPMDKV